MDTLFIVGDVDHFFNLVTTPSPPSLPLLVVIGLLLFFFCQNWLSRLLSRLVVNIVVIASSSASSVSVFGIFVSEK